MRGVLSGRRYRFEPDGPVLDLVKVEGSLLLLASGRFQRLVQGTNLTAVRSQARVTLRDVSLKGSSSPGRDSCGVLSFRNGKVTEIPQGPAIEPRTQRELSTHTQLP